MADVNIHCSWQLEIELDVSRPVEMWVDNVTNSDRPNTNNAYRALLLCEPNEVSKQVRSAVRFRDRFDAILTYERYALRWCRNAHLFPFGGCWIRDDAWQRDGGKDFSVSMICGAKRTFSGHRLRHYVWRRQKRIQVPTRWFNSSRLPVSDPSKNPFLGESKSPLFESMFHICIENVRKENYFTEKLVDCFRTKTVPIYWGCPNIAHCFDINGIITANSGRQMIKACNRLSPELYESMRESIERNYERSFEFADLNGRVSRKLLSLIEGNEAAVELRSAA